MLARHAEQFLHMFRKMVELSGTNCGCEEKCYDPRSCPRRGVVARQKSVATARRANRCKVRVFSRHAKSSSRTDLTYRGTAKMCPHRKLLQVPFTEEHFWSGQQTAIGITAIRMRTLLSADLSPHTRPPPRRRPSCCSTPNHSQEEMHKSSRLSCKSCLRLKKQRRQEQVSTIERWPLRHSIKFKPI